MLCNYETCVAPFDSDMHLEKGNVLSARTVFGGGFGMCHLFSSCIFCLCSDSKMFLSVIVFYFVPALDITDAAFVLGSQIRNTSCVTKAET